MPSSFALPPVECCRGTSPSHAAKSRPLRNAAPLPMAATMAVATIGPMPGILRMRLQPASLVEICSSLSVSSSIIRVKSPRETVAQALVGDYRPEHLFTLKQSLDGYRYYQKLIAELDDEIARLMHTLPNATEHPAPIPKRTKRTAYQRMGNDPLFDLR